MHVCWERAGPPNGSHVTGSWTGNACELGVLEHRGSFSLGHCKGPQRTCAFFLTTVSKSAPPLWVTELLTHPSPLRQEWTNFTYVTTHCSVPLLLLGCFEVTAPPPGRAGLGFVIMLLSLLIPLGNTSLRGSLCFVSTCASIHQTRNP